MKKLNFTKLFKKIFPSPSRDKTKLDFSSDRDWKFVVGLFVFVMIIIAAAHYYIFMKAANNEIFIDNAADIEIVDYASLLDINDLKDAQQYFDTKAETFTRISQEDASQIVDPSI